MSCGGSGDDGESCGFPKKDSKKEEESSCFTGSCGLPPPEKSKSSFDTTSSGFYPSGSSRSSSSSAYSQPADGEGKRSSSSATSKQQYEVLAHTQEDWLDGTRTYRVTPVNQYAAEKSKNEIINESDLVTKGPLQWGAYSDSPDSEYQYHEAQIKGRNEAPRRSSPPRSSSPYRAFKYGP